MHQKLINFILLALAIATIAMLMFFDSNSLLARGMMAVFFSAMIWVRAEDAKIRWIALTVLWGGILLGNILPFSLS